MATKKEHIPDPAFGRAPEPEQMVVSEAPVEAPIEVVPEPKTVVPAHHHGLSEDEARRVAKVKADIGDVVTYLKALRDTVHDAEVQRMYSIAITEVETGSMWAVKAITWRG